MNGPMKNSSDRNCPGSQRSRLQQREIPVSRLLLAGALVTFVTLGLTPSTSYAEVSLAMQDRLDDKPVTINGRLYKFTVIRDAWNRFQWYVVPDRPRLAERIDAKGQRVPELAMFLIQSEDSKKSGLIYEEALLQFAVSLAVPAEANEPLRKAIAEHEQCEASQITLSGLPLSSAEANIYVPATGEFLASATQGAGVGPIFNSQEQAFLLHLTKKGADTLATALQKGNGINISYVLKYEGLTPKAGFKVKVHWDQVYRHFSRQDRAKARASLFGLVTLGGDYDRQQLMNDLENNRCLEVEVIENKGFKKEDAWKFLEPILARINKELEVQLAPPPTEQAARAADPESGGAALPGVFTGFMGGGAGYSVAIKEASSKRQGTETISFAARMHIERTTVAGGFASLKGYPDSVRNDAIIVVPPGPWKSSYFLLPNVGTDIGIKSANLTLVLMRGTERLSTRTAHWEIVRDKEQAKGQWSDKNGPTSVVAFPLLALGAIDAKDLKFLLRLALDTGEDEVILERESRRVTLACRCRTSVRGSSTWSRSTLVPSSSSNWKKKRHRRSIGQRWNRSRSSSRPVTASSEPRSVRTTITAS